MNYSKDTRSQFVDGQNDSTSILKQSPHKSFRVTQLVESVAVCEAINGDRFNWGNATDTEPAFLVYVGCSFDEVEAIVKLFNNFYRCQWCEVRKPKHLKGFEAEIKIRGMQRTSDTNAFGLDYLVESEEAKHFGADYDSINYYTTGYLPRW